MLPEFSLSEIEKNLFKKIKVKDIYVSFNSVVEVYEGNPLKVTITFPMDKVFYSSLSQMDLYQRSADKWASFIMATFKPLVLKAIRLNLKSRVKLKPFDTVEKYNAFWNSSGLQFDLDVTPFAVQKLEEDKPVYTYFDVDDRKLTKGIKRYSKDNWEFLKKLSNDKTLVKRLMSLDGSLKDISAEYFLNFFAEYTDHINYLRRDKVKEESSVEDKGYIKPSLKDKSLFYTHDDKLGFLIRPAINLKAEEYSTGIVLVWADPQYLEGKDLVDLIKPYKFELDLFLDGYMNSQGEIIDKRGSLIHRIYTLRK